MTVHFIGAGPGAADLLTLRGRNLIAGCPVCLYAGSLIPEEILSHCPTGARIINTALWIWMQSLLNAKPPLMPARMWPACILVICRSGRQWVNSFAVCGRNKSRSR